jgi:translation elongation factor EF-Tu-like GTPase
MLRDLSDEAAHDGGQMDSELYDIEAQITFTRTEDGGRRGPARSGYRPQFYYDGHDWDAVQDYGPVEWVFPGQTVTAYLSFLSPECHVGRLYPGKAFLLREGQRTVGQGVVTQLLQLEAHAQGKSCADPRLP